MNEEEGLDEVIKEQNEDLTKKYKEQQNPQDPNTLENILKEKDAKALIDEVMGPDEDDDEGISAYALNRQTLNESRNIDPNRFQEQLNTIQQFVDPSDPQFISELLFDLKTGYSAAKSAPGGPYIRAGAALGAVGLRRLLPEVNYGKLIDNVFETNFFKNREPITVYALGQKKGNPNWRPNLKQYGYFPDSKDAVSQFGEDAVNQFMEKARLHRVNRNKLGKKELMKDFNETLSLTRDDGTEEIAMIVKRKKIGNKLDPTDSSNYHVRTLSQVMKQMRVETKWLTQQLPEVKAMQIIRSKLNQLGTKYSDDLVLAKLMEYGDEAYLEHMIAKDQYDWLWNRVEGKLKKGQTRPYPWVQAPERNHVDNLRLLVSKPYKTLKDQTEGRIKKFNIGKQNKDKYIVNIEDPMTNPFAKDNPLHKSNPGNILIQTAKPSDKVPTTIGIIGDYLQDFYGKDFMKNYNGNQLLTIFEQMSPADKKLYNLYKPKVVGKNVETATAYRRRIFDERIDLILKEKGKFTTEEIQEEIFKDLVDFYDLFAGKAAFVRRPQYVTDVIERMNPKQIDMPFDRRKFNEFYSQKRKAQKDIYETIEAYESGKAPRMTKKDYENAWKQINSISALDYNFKADINDFGTKFINIMGRYE